MADARDPVEIARALIRCRSVTPAEGGALAYLEKLLQSAGFEVQRVKFSEAGTADVENLHARIGSAKPHLVFAGHTDVVPPGDEKQWKHPPFGGDVDGGMLYGRGAVDMKGAIACFAAAALDHVAKGKPKGAISFLITGDEEGPSINGTKKLLAWAAAHPAPGEGDEAGRLLAEVAKELGGDKVSAWSATHALQDPHRIEARPSLIAKARNAQLVVCTGAELEAGWLPPVLRESGNAAVQPGRPGYFEAAPLVARLEIPTKLDRAEGDVHAAGNPHIQLDPRNLLAVAAPLAQRLGELDAANAAFYAERQKAFVERLRAAIARWEKEAAALRGLRVIAQHRSFSYLFHWLGLVEAGTLEPKPGIAPSPRHLEGLVAMMKAEGVKLIVREQQYEPKTCAWIAEKTGAKVAVIGTMAGALPGTRSLLDLAERNLDALLEASGAAQSSKMAP